jgi:hypothetical protein
MKLIRITVAAVLILTGLFTSRAFAGEPAQAASKQAKVAAVPPSPSAEELVNALRQEMRSMRQEMQGQIDSLKSDLAQKSAALKQAQDAVDAQQQAVKQNETAVSTLASSVADMKDGQTAIVGNIADATADLKKQIAAPDVFHYKGITITPGGYLAGETIFRTKATGGDIPTAFSALPYEGADAYSMGEFFGSARQSRISLLAQGKTDWGTLRGYYEADWLGTGITSNNNQSNSYVLRQRVLWAQAETNSHWAFTGGQLWSLATEDKVGISNLSGDIMTPQTIDPNYVVGFVWTRQWGFRVTKTYRRFAWGVAAENPQLLYSAALAGSTPYAVLGSAGQNGGNYNAAISGLSGLTTYVQRYNSVKTIDSVGNTVSGYVPVYNTVYANNNIANLSFNQAPDILVKLASDPGWGHYEVIGIAGFAHQTVYPGVTQNSVKFGGVPDIQGFVSSPSGIAAAPGTPVVPTSTTAGSYVNSITLGGIAASARVPIEKSITFGIKGLYGPGVGRYGNSTLSDVTTDANGDLKPIHNASVLFTLEANPTPRLALYLNYGADYAARADYAAPAITLTSPVATFCQTGVTTANATLFCSANPTPLMYAAGGSWGSHFTNAPTMTAVGYGSRYANIAVNCANIATPSFEAGSVGYLPSPSGCANNTRNVQEFTGGYWYDIYRGDRGRLRQSIQYGYAVREGWSGSSTLGSVSNPAIGAKGIDNMFWTSFRYYLP